MYAVIRTGGKQERVAKGDKIRVEKLAGDVGASIKLNEVLLIADDKASVKIGQPLVDGSFVSAKIVEQGRARRFVFSVKNVARATIRPKVIGSHSPNLKLPR